MKNRLVFVLILACVVYVASAVAPRLLEQWGVPDGSIFRALVISKVILAGLSLLTGIMVF